MTIIYDLKEGRQGKNQIPTQYHGRAVSSSIALMTRQIRLQGVGSLVNIHAGNSGWPGAGKETIILEGNGAKSKEGARERILTG